MGDDAQQPKAASDEKKWSKRVTTTVTCPHCGKQHEVTVEVPESDDAPRMAWQG